MGSLSTQSITTRPSISSNAQTSKINLESCKMRSLQMPPPLCDVKIRWTRYVLANIEPNAREKPDDSNETRAWKSIENKFSPDLFIFIYTVDEIDVESLFM